MCGCFVCVVYDMCTYLYFWQKKNESGASQVVLSKSLMQQKEKESHFLEQLLDPHKIDDYRLPIPVNAELRKYQQVRCILYSHMVYM